MNSRLPKILVISFFIVFLGVLSFFVFQRFQESDQDESVGVNQSSENLNIKGLKESESTTGIVLFNSIDKKNRDIQVINQQTGQDELEVYDVDDGAVLICFKTEEGLRAELDFSGLNVWDSGIYKNIFSYSDEFFESIVGNSVKLFLLNGSNSIVAMAVGGCR